MNTPKILGSIADKMENLLHRDGTITLGNALEIEQNSFQNEDGTWCTIYEGITYEYHANMWMEL